MIICQLIDREAQKAQGEQPQPGDMWYAPELVQPGEIGDWHRRHFLSEEYMAQHGGQRPPLMVCLPSGEWACMDQRWAGGRRGWVITGEAPRITASPSLHYPNYHGWLRDGVLSSDVDGRSYQ